MATGSQLRRERLDHLPKRVTVTAVSEYMGLSRQTVHTIERSEHVDDATALSYRRALALASRDVATGIRAKKAVA